MSVLTSEGIESLHLLPLENRVMLSWKLLPKLYYLFPSGFSTSLFLEHLHWLILPSKPHLCPSLLPLSCYQHETVICWEVRSALTWRVVCSVKILQCEEALAQTCRKHAVFSHVLGQQLPESLPRLHFREPLCLPRSPQVTSPSLRASLLSYIVPACPACGSLMSLTVFLTAPLFSQVFIEHLLGAKNTKITQPSISALKKLTHYLMDTYKRGEWKVCSGDRTQEVNQQFEGWGGEGIVMGERDWSRSGTVGLLPKQRVGE